MEWVAKLIDALRSPKLVSCASISSALLLFIPSKWISGNSFQNLREKYSTFVLLVFVISTSMLLVEMACWFWKRRKQHVTQAKRAIKLLERLYNLDHKEQIILREFFLQDRNTIKLPIDHPVVAGLLRDNILHVISELGRMSHAGALAAVSMTEECKKSLLLEMVGLHGNEPTDEDRERVARERPYFVSKVLEKERIWE